MANSVMASDERFATQKANTGADEEANEEENLNKFSKQEQQQVLLMKDEPDLYTKLAKSVAPGVYGHLDVKKGILL